MRVIGNFTIRSVLLTQNYVNIQRNLSNLRNVRNVTKNYGKYLWIIGGGLATIVGTKMLSDSNIVHARSNLLKSIRKEEEQLVKLAPRERRFIKFSSVEFDGQLFMTPEDFLYSVVEQEPRPRLKRYQLTVDDVNTIRDATPPLKKGSPKMFRDLKNKGIISYTEYLFLLSVLTKPKSGFRIAFNMFDTDGNQRVDKFEFLVIQKILGGSFREADLDEKSKEYLLKLISTKEQAIYLTSSSKMERIFSGAWKEKHNKTDNNEKVNNDKKELDEDDLVDDEEGLQRKHKIDTTLQIHFFGKKGNQSLNYESFHKFMDNLQTEIMELEFHEFAKGQKYISEIDFARILLRYTYLDADEYDMFLERIFDRFKYDQGIKFQEFHDFCGFLNNLEDFSIAMQMYTLADRAISKEEFSRAVKICTGFTLTTHVIDTVFAIFDVDGDGLLSYKEFIAFMKDRLHRGFKSVSKSEGWEAFKYCLKQEMRQTRYTN